MTARPVRPFIFTCFPFPLAFSALALASAASLALAAPAVPGAEPLHAQESRVLVVEGLAGTPDMEERFQRWATRLVDASVDRFGLV
ncbi:MAG: hypothetical protein ACOC8K_06520, partial [Gemmatimonadota bacterium]